jgi:peptidoglycan/xylan/chitin deacetylase (PgdA/CDA1 family)
VRSLPVMVRYATEWEATEGHIVPYDMEVRHSSAPRVAGDEGVFMLSLDTELAWGSVPAGRTRERAWMFAETRSLVRRLLSLLEEFDVKATWAVVGHLMLSRCSPTNGVKHPELVRPDFPWYRGDWMKEDPCSDVRAAPYWYAPDLVEDILRCRSPQEIGCHGFAHVLAGEPGCSRECFESDLRAAIEVARAWGLELRSYVFPQNSIGHLDVLASQGFRAYRGEATPHRVHALRAGTVERSLQALRWCLPVRPLTAYPVSTHGLWNLPASTFYYHRGGPGRLVPIAARVFRARRALREAERTGSIFHMYLHPFNLATDPEGLLGGLATLFRLVAEGRAAGRIQNPTMGEYADALDAREAPLERRGAGG